MPVQKNDIITLTVSGYSSDGSGVARHDGLTVFIKNALDGETVTAHILSVKKTAAFAKVAHVIAPSPERVTPDCGVFGKCGGCDFLHTTYAEELRAKRLRVADALRKIGGVDVDIPPVIPSPKTRGYRNKAIFEIARGKDGRAAIGFYRERSHDVVDVRSCALQSDTANNAAEALRVWLDKPENLHAPVRNLFVRTGEQSAQAVIVAERDAGFDGLVRELRAKCPELTGITLCVNASGGNVVLDGDMKNLYGEPFFTDTVGGNAFRLSPNAFYQVNHAVAELLYGDIRKHAALTADDTALDLYCGAGTITLALARDAGYVYGAEVVPESVANARENAERNGVANVEFLCGDAGDAARELDTRGVRPCVIVVDPPRKGLSPDVVKTVADMAEQRVIYVSCDPATLARDVKLLRGYGFALTYVQPYDMFPSCAHVETLAVLEHGTDSTPS